MGRRIRWGILGAGGIATTFVSDLLGARAAGAEIEVTAVGARDADRARSFAGRFGILRAHGSYEALVADDQVDSVYVGTPHVFHREQALLAIAAGKHVLVEKPIAMNAAEARDIYRAAEAQGVIALEALWSRYTPQSRRLRQIVRAGTIGELRFVTATHAQSLPTDPRHRLNDPALGGGALLDLGVYPVAFAHDLLGAPTSITAQATLSDQGVDRAISSTMLHGEAHSLLFSALDVAMPNPARVVGGAGSIEIDSAFFVPGGFTVVSAEGDVVERYDSDEGGLVGMHHEALELARLVEEGWSDDAPLTPEASTAIMATMDEMRRQVGVEYAADRR